MKVRLCIGNCWRTDVEITYPPERGAWNVGPRNSSFDRGSCL